MMDKKVFFLVCADQRDSFIHITGKLPVASDKQTTGTSLSSGKIVVNSTWAVWFGSVGMKRWFECPIGFINRWAKQY